MKRALISVSDKTGIIDFARSLVALDFEIISTGGTAKVLEEAGISVVAVQEITHFPEILDGRVKTLHPYIHGGILAKDTQEHMQVLKEENIQPIDLVVVNLYPFQETVKKDSVTLEEAIENIDIGGPSMIRAAAKNHERVTVVVNPNQYSTVISSLEKGEIELKERRKLALDAFFHTAQYDAAISGWLKEAFEFNGFTDEYAIGGKKSLDLRYGENPHQKAAFYTFSNAKGTLAGAKQLNGKSLSYNNIVDTDAAWQLVNEWHSQVACAIIKHTNPCGTAIGKTCHEAYLNALKADPLSAFGGIVAFNKDVDEQTAKEIVKIFTEAVIAPRFTDDALKVLKEKENLRIIETGGPLNNKEKWLETVSGGFLLQDRDSHQLKREYCECVTKSLPTEAEWEDMLFAWNVVKHVKSNAIVLAKNQQSLGIGAGQMNRVGSCNIAITQAGEQVKGSVLASDAFFPFRDSIDEAARAGIRAIIQPGGSIRDEECIEAANEAGIAMVFTGVRHFKH